MAVARRNVLFVSKVACVIAALAYVCGLFGWYAVHRLVGDASPLLYSLNALALYFFLPLPLLLIGALLTRRWEVLGAFVAGAVLWLHLWGALFWPPATPTSAADGSLTVMTYNVFGFNRDPDSVIETIEDSGADVVAFQELNPAVAAMIASRLSGEYPYQYLRPVDGVTGMGVISRVPATLLDETIRHPNWVGDPQVLSLDYEGRRVIVLNVHAIAQPRYAAQRLEQAELVAAYSAGRKEPLVVLGDFNATSTNDAIEVMTRRLDDAWREAGSGFGHTFPGASTGDSPGSSRPQYLGIDVPRWLIRIDYVFHSQHWRAVAARNGRIDGQSDHRPVIATLVLKP